MATHWVQWAGVTSADIYFKFSFTEIQLNQVIIFFEKPRYMTCYNDFTLIAFLINHGHENSTGTLTAKKYFVIKVLYFH